MSVYQFVAFDTLFMYLFIYSFSILFYLLLGFNINSLLNPFIKASRTLLLFY